MTLALDCRDLVFSYGQTVVLAIDRLEIPTGLVVAVQGPNGAGKSTLLWLLAGLRRADRGSIAILGQPLTGRRRDLLQQVTLVMEQPYLLRTTARGNVEYGLARRGLDLRERMRRADGALAQVGLESKASSAAWELSQGEKKRLALARALAIQADILLLDEPGSNVDGRSAILIEESIERLRGQTTVVVSTHDIAQARRLADQVVTLVAGRKLDVSHENLVEVPTVLREGRRFAVLLPSLQIPIGSGPEGPVRLLVDPDSVQLGPPQPGSPTMVVSDLSLERHTIRIRLNGEMGLVVRLPREGLDELPLTLGQQVAVTIPPEALHLL
ncbi:MAG: ATP-binding cassette domain-containing protein [Bradymonadales bacterium]|nr:ATP-binding cassette domain-containing protein [Bradymonadales bacterium]